MEHDFTEFPIRIAIILRFGFVNAITIEFLCKSNSFFSFYKRKLKKRINFPVPVIHNPRRLGEAIRHYFDNPQSAEVIIFKGKREISVKRGEIIKDFIKNFIRIYTK